MHTFGWFPSFIVAHLAFHLSGPYLRFQDDDQPLVSLLRNKVGGFPATQTTTEHTIFVNNHNTACGTIEG